MAAGWRQGRGRGEEDSLGQEQGLKSGRTGGGNSTKVRDSARAERDRVRVGRGSAKQWQGQDRTRMGRGGTYSRCSTGQGSSGRTGAAQYRARARQGTTGTG